MAIKRSVNIISQGRIDTPDLRSIESAARNDFDDLFKSFVTGTSQGYILRGFEILMAGAIGGAASGLQMSVDPGAVLHINSSQAGTVFLVPSGAPAELLNSAINTIVDGAFSPSSINYVGIEYERFLDAASSSQVYLWDPTSNTETTKTAPRASVLRYRIKISTTSFASNVLPIATILTDAGNNVVSVTDSRFGLFRLGTGGSSPNPFYTYPWTAQTEGRTENPSTSTSNGVSPFRGGDKMLGTLKDWMDSVMSSLLEIKGTTYWYSQSSAGSLESLRQDLGNTIITGRGNISHSPTSAGRINWSDDIKIQIVGSRLSYTLLANASSTDITLTDEKVAYINLVRGVVISPNLIFTNGSPIIASVGSVAWTSSLQSGDFVKLGSDTDAYYYQIQSVDSLSQVTLTTNFSGTSTGAAGAKAKYAFGVYQTNPAPSTNRHIYIANRELVPVGENIFWLMMRADNSGSTPRVYVKFLGAELQQGETEEISDTTALEILQYMGSPSESASAPMYVSAINPGSIPEITDLLLGAASTISSNQYFLINSSGNYRTYYVWFNKDGTGVDPKPPGINIGVQVNIATGQTDVQVANATALAISASLPGDFNAIQKDIPNNNQVRITNTSAGVTVSAVNFNVGAPFAITVVQIGTGSGNFAIRDSDSLTLSIKKLDESLGAIEAALDDPSYDETVQIVASGATPPTSLNAPVTSGTLITLPLNSRVSNIQQMYTVGKGILQVFLNGQYLVLGNDWLEVGVSQAPSDQIQILQNLYAGDILEFRMSGVGSGFGGGGGPGPQGPPGIQGPAGVPGADAVGGPVAISTKTANYSVLGSDNVLLANCSGGAISFFLPPVATVVGQVFYFKKIDSSSNAMNIVPNGVELIDGVGSLGTNTQWQAFTLINDGSAFYIF